eukprot:CAMPEP_0115203164 /NCGR_PEP_ID=MMETSP0270-20121206/18506_1 /TAXON_ID=71861 /ORGANISM="Scrippsiella trochoidea, Strain CCMP3099" /LENGTH=31 /DNA_ID= /DNA_START= /DNA_END= /DNA_ORIENTATION=
MTRILLSKVLPVVALATDAHNHVRVLPEALS